MDSFRDQEQCLHPVLDHRRRDVRLRSWLSLAVISTTAAVLAACADSASTEPDGVPGAYLTGVVRDADGNPVPQITVVWEAWPAPDSAEQGSVSDYSVYGSG